MKTNFMKIAAVTAVFAASYLGVNSTTQTRKIAGRNINVSVVSLGTTARAYCNEAADKHNNGLCTGFFEDPTTRCLEPANPLGSLECKL